MPRKNRQIKHVRLEAVISNCDKKRAFKTEKQAIVAADYQMLTNMGLEIAVYKCESCRMWHLTQINKRFN